MTRRHLALWIAPTVLMTACAGAPPKPQEMDPVARENAIFACRKENQAKKKEHFEKLPALLKRIAGDNQVLQEFSHVPSKREVWRAIAKFPLAGDSGGTWRLSREANQRTVSTRFEFPARSKSPGAEQIDSGELVTLVFGQPGRVYSFPLESLKGGSSSLKGRSQEDSLEIRAIDEHHVLLIAVSAPSTPVKKAPAKQASAPPVAATTLFYPQNQFAVVRTYVEQSFAEESAEQLPDYPVYDARTNQDCDQKVDQAFLQKSSH